MRIPPGVDREADQNSVVPPIASTIVKVWTRDYLARPWISRSLGALFAAYIAYLLLLGPVPSTTAANDVFLMLDGGWRILNGLVPNRDFYLSLGPLTYMFVAGGLWVARDSAFGITIGLTAFAAIIAIFAFLTSRTRMTAAGSILFSSFILLLCTSPMPQGGNPSSDLTYGMIFNRWGYGVLSLLFVTQILRPNKAADDAADWFGDIVAGTGLATLLFLKVSYFGIGGGLLLLTTLADRRTIRHVIRLALGFVPVTLAFLAFLRFHVLSFSKDILDTIHARSVSHFGISDLFGLNTTSLAAFALCLVFLGWRDTTGRNRGWLVVLMAYTILAEVLFVRTNTSHGSLFPLYIVLVFILLADLGRTVKLRNDVSPAFAAALVVFGLGLVAPAFYLHFRSLALLTSYKTSASIQAGATRVDGRHLQSLTFYDGPQPDELSRLENGHFYTTYLNDGIDLLRKNTSDNESVTSLGFHNPFSYALLRRPPVGGSTWFELGINVSRDHWPSNDRMLGDASLVMTPKYPSSHQTTDEFLFEIYKPYLTSDFSLVAESQWWRLYRRLKPASP
jgi:hypothetical protein